MTTTEPRPQSRAPIEGPVFAELSGMRVVWVGGSDARRWLGDLITADVAGLSPATGRRSLVLSPTGRIRADVHVAAAADGFRLLQWMDQPEPVDKVLAPYVLSSDVVMEDRTSTLSIVAVLSPDAEPPPGATSPSIAGDGFDAAIERATVSAFTATLERQGIARADPDRLDTLRVLRGSPRLGVDYPAGALPAEAGLEETIDLTKGCFLGQESVARVRNLGHPPTVTIHARVDGTAAPGDRILTDGETVGSVTSVALDRNGGTVVLGRVRWGAADAVLRLGEGTRLQPTG
jgi:folate-binding protein YgfZ